MADEEFVARFPTPDAYAAHHERAGHMCCGCISQDPPLPCCNPGHAEAEQAQVEFDRVIRETFDGDR